MISNLGSNLVFSEIEYFTYLNLGFRINKGSMFRGCDQFYLGRRLVKEYCKFNKKGIEMMKFL
jgi:hypothetical protein